MKSARKNGCERPWRGDQLAVVCLTLLTHACLFGSTILFWSHTLAKAVLCGSAVLFMIKFACWVVLERTDPAEPKTRIKLFTKHSRPTRYCPSCRKTVPGLDHHCEWLNTCVADATYDVFLGLVGASTLLYIVQLLYGALSVSLPGEEGILVFDLRTALVLGICNCAAGFFLGGWHGVLLGFHVMLSLRKQGTYDYLVQQRSIADSAVEVGPLSAETADRQDRERREWLRDKAKRESRRAKEEFDEVPLSSSSSGGEEEEEESSGCEECEAKEEEEQQVEYDSVTVTVEEECEAEVRIEELDTE